MNVISENVRIGTLLGNFVHSFDCVPHWISNVSPQQGLSLEDVYGYPKTRDSLTSNHGKTLGSGVS